MNSKKKIVGIVIATSDYKRIFNQNKELFNQLSKDFGTIYVLNMIKFKFREKNTKIQNQKLFPKNFHFLNFSKSEAFLNYFRDKQMFAIQYLGKDPDYFKIFYLLKKVNVKNIMISNLGNFGNKTNPEFHLSNVFAFSHYYQKGFYYIFRILTILNLFPKIDLLFESNVKVIKAHNNGLSRKFERLFPFFKISYFRKIKKINSIFFDQFVNVKSSKKKNYILYIDVPINHADRVLREGDVPIEIQIKFYQNLNCFLKKISKIFKKKVIIGAHPSSKIALKYLSNFEISKKRTIDLIPNCELAVVTHSSLISSAVIYNKKILSIRSKYLGKYISNLANNYQKTLGLTSLNIDKNNRVDKNNIVKKMNLSKKKYKKYLYSRIIPDGKNKPYEKITKIIKRNFFD